MLECAQNFRRIELHVIFNFNLIRLDSAEKVTALDHFHLDVDAIRIVESVISPDNEMVIKSRVTQVH